MRDRQVRLQKAQQKDSPGDIDKMQLFLCCLFSSRVILRVCLKAAAAAVTDAVSPGLPTGGQSRPVVVINMAKAEGLFQAVPVSPLWSSSLVVASGKFTIEPSCHIRKAAFRLACSKLQQKVRDIQNKWWTSLAEKIQLCADTGDYRGFYEALKTAYGPTHQVQSPLLSADGQMLLTDKVSILNRWSEHFQTLFSTNRVVVDSAMQFISQQSVKTELDTAPTMGETLKAMQQVKIGKAAGVDGIPPEIWKHGGQALHAKFHEFVVRCWERDELPSDLRDAVIVTLYKRKGDKSDCSNYREELYYQQYGKLVVQFRKLEIHADSQ